MQKRVSSIAFYHFFWKETKISKKKKTTPADKWVGHAGKIICCHNPERSYQSVSWSTFKQKMPLRFKIPNIKIEHFSSIDNTNILSPHKEILFFQLSLSFFPVCFLRKWEDKRKNFRNLQDTNILGPKK
jgi:hypothetical protein